jgi:hypothetical protein
MPQEELIGDKNIVIFLPTKDMEENLIEPNNRRKIRKQIEDELNEIGGGSTGSVKEEIKVGTYKLNERRTTVEPVTYIYTKVTREKLANNVVKRKLFKAANSWCKDLKQDAIGVEWGDAFYIIKSEDKAEIKPVPFKSYNPSFQETVVELQMRRTDSIDDLPYLLQLDQWQPMRQDVSLTHSTSFYPICKKGNQIAYVSKKRTDSKRRQFFQEKVNERDLIFEDKNGKGFRVWMKIKNSIRGGREIPFSNSPLTRRSVELILAILGSKEVDPLPNIIDREAITSKFFQAYQHLYKNLREAFQDRGLIEKDAAHEAEVLLSRLMFLKFLEKKRWLDGDPNYLRNKFDGKRFRSFFDSVLDPLFFDVLDVPEEKRKKDVNVPFLNGGLFKAPSRRNYDLPDELFDPGRQGSVLQTFDQFEFFADEIVGREDNTRVDPSMFGFILESMYGQDERREQGVHYTPDEIARTLAREALTSRISKCTGIPLSPVYTLFESQTTVNATEAQQIEKCLPDLRIVDPAVGSGGLLIAVFHTLMDLYERCQQIQGVIVKKGHFKWAEVAEHFVTQCLYGVDIDREAVDIARLRLWLALSVGSQEPRKLPDLSYNIRAGDSLSEFRPYTQLKKKLINARTELAFSPQTAAEDRFLAAIDVFESERSRDAGDKLAEAEREFAACEVEAERSEDAAERATRIRSGQDPVPFFWHLHFRAVFERENRGFDIVIGNPPYVSSQNLGSRDAVAVQAYKKRFQTMNQGNINLYAGFVERAIELAGSDGEVAFIMPNFARVGSAQGLRVFLGERGAIKLWIDFGDIQVFPSASNYVILLFAEAKKNRRQTFPCRIVDAEQWTVRSEEDWFIGGQTNRISCRDATWRIISREGQRKCQIIEKGRHTLSELVKGIEVGVQTSLDRVYILSGTIEGKKRRAIELYSSHLGQPVSIESALLRRCIGKRYIRPYQITGNDWIIWPYDRKGKLLTEKQLKSRFPLGWEYLKACEDVLRKREQGKLDGPNWWRFRRPQGVSLSYQSKIMVPSLLGEATAFWDQKGEIAFTGSGKGGGGMWGIRVDEESSIHPRWILAVLNSTILWDWFWWEGSLQKDQFRGVDRGLLERVPIPMAPKRIQEEVARLTEQVEDLYLRGEEAGELQYVIDDRIIAEYKNQ